MGMPKGLAKATNYYNTIEARRDFWKLAYEIVDAGHSEIVRKHTPPEDAGWRRIDKSLAAMRAEWRAFQQSVHPTDGGHSQADSESNPATISG